MEPNGRAFECLRSCFLVGAQNSWSDGYHLGAAKTKVERVSENCESQGSMNSGSMNSGAMNSGAMNSGAVYSESLNLKSANLAVMNSESVNVETRQSRYSISQALKRVGNLVRSINCTLRARSFVEPR